MFQPILVFLERFGTVVGRLVMTLIYIVAVAPVAIVYKLVADPLLTKSQPESTFREWSQVNETLEDARRQD